MSQRQITIAEVESMALRILPDYPNPSEEHPYCLLQDEQSFKAGTWFLTHARGPFGGLELGRTRSEIEAALRELVTEAR